MAEHWPVSIIWDSSLFGDFCNLESSLGFTEIADVGYGLSRFDSISTEGFYGSSRPYSIYLTPQGDTISPVLCVQFSDSANVQSTDFVEIENFTIYPNPATNFLIIKIPQDKLHCRILYDLFNSKGSLVKSSELDSDRKIDINDIDKGLYFLRLHLPSNGICTKAFIKLK